MDPSYTIVVRFMLGDIERVVASEDLVRCEVLDTLDENYSLYKVEDTVTAQNWMKSYDNFLL